MACAPGQILRVMIWTGFLIKVKHHRMKQGQEVTTHMGTLQVLYEPFP